MKLEEEDLPEVDRGVLCMAILLLVLAALLDLALSASHSLVARRFGRDVPAKICTHHSSSNAAESVPALAASCMLPPVANSPAPTPRLKCDVEVQACLDVCEPKEEEERRLSSLRAASAKWREGHAAGAQYERELLNEDRVAFESTLKQLRHELLNVVRERDEKQQMLDEQSRRFERTWNELHQTQSSVTRATQAHEAAEALRLQLESRLAKVQVLHEQTQRELKSSEDGRNRAQVELCETQSEMARLRELHGASEVARQAAEAGREAAEATLALSEQERNLSANLLEERIAMHEATKTILQNAEKQRLDDEAQLKESQVAMKKITDMLSESEVMRKKWKSTRQLARRENRLRKLPRTFVSGEKLGDSANRMASTDESHDCSLVHNEQSFDCSLEDITHNDTDISGIEIRASEAEADQKPVEANINECLSESSDFLHSRSEALCETNSAHELATEATTLVQPEACKKPSPTETPESSLELVLDEPAHHPVPCSSSSPTLEADASPVVKRSVKDRWPPAANVAAPSPPQTQTRGRGGSSAPRDPHEQMRAKLERRRILLEGSLAEIAELGPLLGPAANPKTVTPPVAVVVSPRAVATLAQPAPASAATGSFPRPWPQSPALAESVSTGQAKLLPNASWSPGGGARPTSKSLDSESGSTISGGSLESLPRAGRARSSTDDSEVAAGAGSETIGVGGVP